MMRKGLLLAVWLGGMIVPNAALAQPTETGETGLITIPTTRTVDPGKVQLGAYFRWGPWEQNKTFEDARVATELSTGRTSGITDTDLTRSQFSLGVGIMDGLEISSKVSLVDFQIDQPLEDDEFTEVGDVRITPKFRLFEEGESPMPFSLAFMGSVVLPTGSDRFPATLDRNTQWNEEVGWEVMAILDKILFTLPGDAPVVLTANIGGLFPGEPDVFRLDRQTERVFAQLRRKGFPDVEVNEAVVQYAGGINVPLWKDQIGQLDLTGEFRGNTGTIDEIDDYRQMLAGVRYMLVNGWALQGGMDFGLSNSVENYETVVGLSWTGPQPPPAFLAAPKERVVYRDRVIQVEKIIFSDITFEFDKATLTDVGRGRVYLVAQKLKEGKNVKVEIQGHTDYIGTDDYNKQLGLKRAETVKSELGRLGVDASQISTVSYGETKPLIDMETPWARAVNRRTEFVIVSEGEPTTSTTESVTESEAAPADESEMAPADTAPSDMAPADEAPSAATPSLEEAPGLVPAPESGAPASDEGAISPEESAAEPPLDAAPAEPAPEDDPGMMDEEEM